MISTMTDPLTPISFLRRSATLFPDRLAIVDAGFRLSYAQFWRRVRLQAGLLKQMGVQPGDRVAVLSPNSRMLLEAHYAVPLAGAILVTLNTRLTAAELTYIIEHSGSSALLYDSSLTTLASHLPIGRSMGSASYERELPLTSPLEIHIKDERDLIALNYTSGTTGRPKGVMCHHRGAFLQALAMAYHAHIDTNTVHLWTLPMFHCNGWAFTWAVTAGGGTHVCLPKPDPTEIWHLIDTEGITSLNAAPTVLIDLASNNAAHRLERLVKVGTGGSPPSPTLLLRLDELGFEVTHMYGLTETFGPSAISEFPADWMTLPMGKQSQLKARQGNANIVGRPLRVVDQDGADTAADGYSMGEVVIRGNTVALGYYNDPQATEAAFGSGWFHTGDLGVMHPDNYIELRDRLKDIVISGGENIASIEIEQALSRHPAVHEVAVVAAEHERWGEVPVAYVTLSSDITAPSEHELIKFASRYLARFKVPRRIFFEELPKTSTGKIQKHLLRERHVDYSGGLERSDSRPAT